MVCIDSGCSLKQRPTVFGQVGSNRSRGGPSQSRWGWGHPPLTVPQFNRCTWIDVVGVDVRVYVAFLVGLPRQRGDVPGTRAILVGEHQATSKAVDDRRLVRHDADVPQLVVHLRGAGDDPRRLVRSRLTARRQRVGRRAAVGVGVVEQSHVEHGAVVEPILAQHVLRPRAYLAPAYTIRLWKQPSWRKEDYTTIKL